ncbi:LXG domain of WXG superfamily protein [Terribacillus halophilus]|uniref:LXG domain of WXG superfamily protein n=1 Tax=Terribacillus halophilus TaxID=361279 RepID=A0A1G6PWZ3_9BACI|nr:T7SS effector LXG polymorphic toxin [Terribacillus halophilus]SDC84568.1 LXG domain of WXG superfamily protein [Terribacillus halophilus]
MGNKVDMSEINRFSEDLANISSNIAEVLKRLDSDIKKITNMDSFGGKAADNAKSYYTNVHGLTIKLFQELWSELEVNLSNHIETFATVVDTDKSAIIENNYLMETSKEIDTQHAKLETAESSIHKTIDGILDICSVDKPQLKEATAQKEKSEEFVETTVDNLESYQSSNYGDIGGLAKVIDQIGNAMTEAGKKSGTERFEKGADSSFANVMAALNKATTNITYVKDGLSGYTTNKPVMQAAKDLGLTVSRSIDKTTGKPIYRIYASEEALKKLGVEPDYHARQQLKHKRSGIAKNNWRYEMKVRYKQKATLMYYDKKAGKHVWSTTGKPVVEKYPVLKGWKKKASFGEKFESFKTEWGKGFKGGLKDTFNVKSLVSDLDDTAKGVSKTAGKAIAPLGVGLGYYTNYNDAKKDGLRGTEAHIRAAEDTAIDTAISTGVQAAFTAAGTAFIPIPGVGTAVGIGLGVLTNWAISKEWKNGKSLTGMVKDGFHKFKGWFK